MPADECNSAGAAQPQWVKSELVRHFFFFFTIHAASELKWSQSKGQSREPGLVLFTTTGYCNTGETDENSPQSGGVFLLRFYFSLPFRDIIKHKMKSAGLTAVYVYMCLWLSGVMGT